MIRNAFFVFILLLACSSAQAATVYLKNGSTVTGKFVLRNDDSVKIDVSGVTLTYYNDEIDRVVNEDEKAAAPAPAAPEAASAAQPAAADAGPAAQTGVTPAQAQPEVPGAVAKSAGPDPYAGMTKRDLIAKFLEVYGTRKVMSMNFEQMLKTIPPNAVPVFQRIIKADEIIQALIPVYDKFFTKEDLIVLINFFSTPVGNKFVESVPALMNESVSVSAKYFEEHLQELATELKKAGVTSNPKKP